MHFLYAQRSLFSLLASYHFVPYPMMGPTTLMLLTLIMLNKLRSMSHTLLTVGQLDYLTQIVDINSHTDWQPVQIQINWLLQKPADLDLHCLQRQGIYGFSKLLAVQADNKFVIFLDNVLQNKYFEILFKLCLLETVWVKFVLSYGKKAKKKNILFVVCWIHVEMLKLTVQGLFQVCKYYS